MRVMLIRCEEETEAIRLLPLSLHYDAFPWKRKREFIVHEVRHSKHWNTKVPPSFPSLPRSSVWSGSRLLCCDQKWKSSSLRSLLRTLLPPWSWGWWVWIWGWVWVIAPLSSHHKFLLALARLEFATEAPLASSWSSQLFIMTTSVQ